MSENDRALELVVVGLGGGGGRLAGEMAQRGYRTVAFHSDRRAQEEQQHISKERCHFIGEDDGPGTAGNPAEGLRMIRDNARRIEDIVRADARDGAFVLVMAGLGGGTGSAVAELVRSLDRDVAKVVVLATLPTAGATAETKVNAVHAIRELTRSDLDGLILIDDARLTDLNADVPILEYRDTINGKIVEPLDAINRLVGREDLTPMSSLDGSRLLRVLTAGGTLNYGVSEIDGLSAEQVSDAISESLLSSWLVAAGIEPSAVSALQIVLEVPKQTLAATPVRVVEQLREQWKADTDGASVDVSIYEAANASSTTVRVLASCAALPARVHQLVGEAAAEARTARAKPHALPELDIAELDEVGEGSGVFSQRGLDKKKRTKRASQSASGAPRAAAARPLPGLRKPSEPPPPRDDTAVTDEDGELPGRSTYARIVTRYRNTSNDELRAAIARRLEQDRLSEHAEVRFHAVDAMAKIGVATFEAALVAATEDDDLAVREVADRALMAMPTRMGRALAH